MFKPGLEPTPRSTLHRRKQRGSHERQDIDLILDESFLCQVAFVHRGQPVVLPTLYARLGDELILHGAPSNRMYQTLLEGGEACISVTLVDGLVLGKTALHHSLNYRSVVLFGRVRQITDRRELGRCFAAIVDAALPGRYAETLPATSDDYEHTLVLAFPIREGSAKVRAAPPLDDDATARGFAGVVPLRTVAERAVATADSAAAMPHLSQLTRLQPGDRVAALGVLQRAFGWDDVGGRIAAARLARYCRAQPDGWFGLWAQAQSSEEPRLVAVGGGLAYGDAAYLGLVGVDPALQRRGLGRLLLRRLERWAEARGAERILLDASEQGAPLYAAEGFVQDDDTLWYCRTGEASSAARGVAATVASGAAARRATAADLEQLVRLDAEAVGGDRRHLLRACIDDGVAYIHEAGGYCIAQDFGVGPVVAANATVAGALLDAALSGTFVQPPVVICRASHREMKVLLQIRGFTCQRRLSHMRKGGSPISQPDVWALQSLATG